MRRPLLARTVVTAAAAALLVAGCGGGGAASTSSKDPKAAFASGLSGLTDTDALTVTLKLETTADALVAFAKQSGTTIDPVVARDVVAAQIVFESKTLNGKKLSELTPGQTGANSARIAMVDNGKTYAEFRSRDKAVFLQADVKGLLDLFRQPNVYKEVTARAATLPEFVRALVAGKWVSLDIAALTGLAGQLGVNASPNPAQSQKLVAELKTVLTRDVAVTRIGTDDQGDHLKLTAHSKQIATDLIQAFQSSVPAAGLALSKVDPSKVTAHAIVLDAWLSSGTLSKLSIDVAQFAPPGDVKPGASLPFVLTFDRSGDDIAKPDGATPVDLTQLGSLLGGLGSLGA
jgi:hypothetical protein